MTLEKCKYLGPLNASINTNANAYSLMYIGASFMTLMALSATASSSFELTWIRLVSSVDLMGWLHSVRYAFNL